MSGKKTRCNQCVNADKKATEKPCDKCGEVQFGRDKHDNHFINASKSHINNESIRLHENDIALLQKEKKLILKRVTQIEKGILILSKYNREILRRK